MKKKLVVNYGDFDVEFFDFDTAVLDLEIEFRFVGEEWDKVVESRDIEKLCAFLIANDEQAELFESEEE